MLQAGRLPMWTPQLTSGYPIMSDGSTGAMYPINLFLFRYFAPYTAYQLAMATVPLMTLVTAWYFLRQRQYSRWACWLGASSFAFGGSFRPNLQHLEVLQGLCMLPLTLMFVDRYLTRRRGSDMLLGSAALGMQVLSGAFELLIPTVLGALLVTLVRCGEEQEPIWTFEGQKEMPRWRQVLQAWQLLPLLVLVGCLIGAPQLMLTMDLFPAALFPTAGGTGPTSYAPLALSSLLVGSLSPLGTGLENIGRTYLYPGVVPLLLGLSGLWSVLRRPRERAAGLILFASGLLLSLRAAPTAPLEGVSGFFGLVYLTPPSAYLLLGLLGLAELSAAGFDDLLERLRSSTQLPVWTPGVAGILLMALTSANLATVGSRQAHWIDRSTVFTPPESRDKIPAMGIYRLFANPADTSPDRATIQSELSTAFLAQRALSAHNFNLILNKAVVGASVQLPFRAFRRLEDQLEQELTPGGEGFKLSAAGFQLLDFLGVRMLTSLKPVEHEQLIPLEPVQVKGLPGPIHVFGIDEPLPRAYLARGLHRCSEEVALQRILQGRFGFGWQPCQNDPSVTTAPEEASAGVAGFVNLDAHSDVYLEYTVNLLNPGYLVVRESYAPGWMASVDGAAAELIPVDLVYRAAAVPAGSHKVRLEYRPDGMAVGLILNTLGLLIVGLGVLFLRTRDAGGGAGDDSQVGGRWFEQP
jgi:hypothetical protein